MFNFYHFYQKYRIWGKANEKLVSDDFAGVSNLQKLINFTIRSFKSDLENGYFKRRNVIINWIHIKITDLIFLEIYKYT